MPFSLVCYVLWVGSLYEVEVIGSLTLYNLSFFPSKNKCLMHPVFFLWGASGQGLWERGA